MTDFTGQRFGKLIVTGDSGRRTPTGNILWGCRCDCGGSCDAVGGLLRGGGIDCCGCSCYSIVACAYIKGGRKLRRTNYHYLYPTWEGMFHRCYNPRDSRFKDYGGRGIIVCERWHSFKAFVDDMGERPEGYSIDRVDVNGIYDPSNCRWAGKEIQARNKRNSKLLEHNGEVRAREEWAKITGIPTDIIDKRIKSGWPVVRALTMPLSE